MRKDLDTFRERHVARETRAELGGLGADWGWVALHASVAASARRSERVATGEELAKLEPPMRPGTSDGGF